MLRSVLLLCSSRPVWAVRSMFGTNLQHELSLNPLWYGTKAFEKQYDNQASCFCKQAGACIGELFETSRQQLANCVVHTILRGTNHFDLRFLRWLGRRLKP